MNPLDNIRFHGTFRTYQQQVLDNSQTYVQDGRIHIVAAPGSGKTVLGLELIRRLGQPCLILSPTTAIREQWGARLRDLFLDDPEDFSSLFSTNLHHIKAVNSITYQALYSAMERAAFTEDEQDTDYGDVDLFALIRAQHIGTICLDEAHHLKNEWQRALEKLIDEIGQEVTIIALTATPPYDAEGTEWERYTRICGPVDEEIFVPDLVAQDTLCPHQDYVYFNYPTQEEAASLQRYKQNSAAAVEGVCALEFMPALCQQLNASRDYDALFSAVKGYVALLVLFRHQGLFVEPKLIRILTDKKVLPAYRINYAETAIQFLLDGELLCEEQKEAVTAVLKEHGVYSKRRVQLSLNDNLKRTLVSSVGKLSSIREIAACECAGLGSSLRMLILTDYIKKENVPKIGTEEPFSSVHVVSIFETLRRAALRVPIGVLSGSLIILPDSIDLSEVRHKKEPLGNTGYNRVELAGSNHSAVAFVGRLFEAGELQILVGTKSLLGEGWDSPCINSLILASFVGSFVLSNQMRGRAIRIDKNDPQKVANIWHLVTAEPDYIFADNKLQQLAAYGSRDTDQLQSYDFEMLKRRFLSFMGPNYTTGVIESGIGRITAIQPPYDQKGIDRINHTMLSLASRRQDVKEKWNHEVKNRRFAVTVETAVDKEKSVPVFTFFNIAQMMMLAALQSLLYLFFRFWVPAFPLPMGAIATAAQAALLYGLYRILKKFLLHASPARSIKALGTAIYEALRECKLISESAIVDTKQDKELNYVYLYLYNASLHDQNLFNTAMAEFLSPIENPRYLLIEKQGSKYLFDRSFACPSVLGEKKEYAQVLAKHLQATGHFDLIYTRREEGRRLILQCRKKSYITANQQAINSKYTVSHWE